MLKLIKKNMNSTQQKMTSLANKKRSERTFNIGDWVYLKLHPYMQKIMFKGSHTNYQLGILHHIRS